MRLPGVRPEIQVLITSLCDAGQCRRGTLPEDQVRSVLVLNPRIDLRVLSVTLPSKVIEFLGLSAHPITPGRLNPIEVTVNGRTCSIDPFQSRDNDEVVIGHVPLTALGLMLDEDGNLVDDPFPSR